MSDSVPILRQTKKKKELLLLNLVRVRYLVHVLVHVGTRVPGRYRYDGLVGAHKLAGNSNRSTVCVAGSSCTDL